MYELPDDRESASAFAFLDAYWAQRIRHNTSTQAPPDLREPPIGDRNASSPADSDAPPDDDAA
jgi:hypothetical protein